VTQFNDLKQQIQIDHFPENQPSIQTYEIDNQYIISDICMNYLSRIKSSSKEKDEFVCLCQNGLKTQPQRLAILQEFQESYSSNRVLSWFSRDPFFYQIIETAFQCTHIETMYLCRFFIRDIQKQFDQFKCTSSVQVYRGQLISNEHFQQLINFEGKSIAIKSFLFTTIDRSIAMAFISEENEQKRVLFDIEANPDVESFIKTDDEVLFKLGSIFKINQILHEDNGIIIIKMTLTANENTNLFKNNNEETDLIGFVQLQCDLSQFLNQPRILNNIDKLIENYLNEIPDDHSDRIRCYDTLGNVNYTKNDLDSSLNWYQKSLEIKKRILSLNDPQLIGSYNNIAFVYLQKRDPTKALETFKQVLIISKEIYGDDHLNVISCYNNMINIYDSEENYSEILSCYHQIVIIMLKHYQIDDANFAPIYNNMGRILVGLGQYHLALGYYKASLEIKLKTLPRLNESTAMTYKSIGVVDEYLGNMDQARVHFEKAIEIYRELYSSTHEAVVEIEKLIQNLS
jgi:tetratricopeptide (TPR) repeat protein